jgi:hypothetical protein
VNAGDSTSPFGSTRSDLVSDSGTIDMGAHVPVLQERNFSLDNLRAFTVETQTEKSSKEFDLAGRKVIQSVAEELRDSRSNFFADSETIIIWFDDQEFPWVVTVEADAF